MKEIQIADQPILGFSRIAQITADGIRYRLFRSLVTVAVIAVAVAFLMNILSASLHKRAIGESAREEMAELNLARKWASRLTAVGSREELVTDLAKAEATDPLIAEAAAFGGLDADEMAELHASVRNAQTYLHFFTSLDYGRRRNLTHTAVGLKIFSYLRTETGWKRFTDGLGEMKSVRFVGTVEEFQQFLAGWENVAAKLEAIREGQRRAVAHVEKALAGRNVLAAMVDIGGDFGDALDEAGFHLPPEQTAAIATQSRDALDRLRIEEARQKKPIAQLIAQHANVLTQDVNLTMLWSFLTRESQASAFLDTMRGAELDVTGLDAERITELAGRYHTEQRITKAQRLTADAGVGWLGLGERMAWLLAVSLLVCGIGIANAMLMTVTERFREIATLKCLGALDGVIMAMFVLESCVFGLVGGVAGSLLGAGIGLSRTLVTFGTASLGVLPVTDLVVGMAAAILLGVVLAALAAVYPSFKAARLAPMEAMRID